LHYLSCEWPVDSFSSDCVYLCSLTLEWNDLGLIENAFSVFCDGVGSNGALMTLDLRSNQISHVGAGELANALKRNSTLQTLGILQSVNSFCLVFGDLTLIV